MVSSCFLLVIYEINVLCPVGNPRSSVFDRFFFAIGNFAVNPLAWCGFRGLNWTQRSGVAGAEHNVAAKHLP